MNSRNSMLISAGIHLAIFVVLIIAPMAELRVPKERFVPINMAAIPEPIIEPEPEPEQPEPEPPKEEPKLSDELIRDMQEKVNTPKPTPTTKPTVKPTPRPTQKPTQRPTARPTLTPMPTSTPLPTLVPTVPYEKTLAEVLNEIEQENKDKKAEFTITGESGTDYDFDSYSDILRLQLQRSWVTRDLQRRPEMKEYTTVVSFTVTRDGSIYDVMIDTASGWEKMDTSVGEAVMKTDQKAPLPRDYTANQVRVTFPFVLTLPENQRR